MVVGLFIVLAFVLTGWRGGLGVSVGMFVGYLVLRFVFATVFRLLDDWFTDREFRHRRN